MTRVLIIDDHPIFRLGLSTLLRTVPDIDIVGEAADATDAVDLADRLAPEVVLMDVRLREGSGIEACREIRSRRPDTHILMLTSFSDEEAVIASLLAGASGYVIKDGEPERLIEAIDTVAQGGSLLDLPAIQTLLAWLRREHTPPGNDPLAGLSAQERRILPLIAEGKINREIAASLALSEHTIKTYISKILQKLQLTRRSELAAFVARLNKLPEPGHPAGE